MAIAKYHPRVKYIDGLVATTEIQADGVASIATFPQRALSKGQRISSLRWTFHRDGETTKQVRAAQHPVLTLIPGTYAVQLDIYIIETTKTGPVRKKVTARDQLIVREPRTLKRLKVAN